MIFWCMHIGFPKQLKSYRYFMFYRAWSYSISSMLQQLTFKDLILIRCWMATREVIWLQLRLSSSNLSCSFKYSNYWSSSLFLLKFNYLSLNRLCMQLMSTIRFALTSKDFKHCNIERFSKALNLLHDRLSFSRPIGSDIFPISKMKLSLKSASRSLCNKARSGILVSFEEIIERETNSVQDKMVLISSRKGQNDILMWASVVFALSIPARDLRLWHCVAWNCVVFVGILFIFSQQLPISISCIPFDAIALCETLVIEVGTSKVE